MLGLHAAEKMKMRSADGKANVDWKRLYRSFIGAYFKRQMNKKVGDTTRILDRQPTRWTSKGGSLSSASACSSSPL